MSTRGVCSTAPHGYLSTPKPSPRTHRDYTPVCWPNRAAFLPEPELPRPPPGSHCWARTSACSPSPRTHLAPSLGHLGAKCATLCSAPLLSSPETERSRPCHHWSAASARWRHLWPIHRYQSRGGEANLRPVPFVCLRRTHIAGGEPPSATEGTLVGICGLEGLAA
jgi:hypothetical protein